MGIITIWNDRVNFHIPETIVLFSGIIKAGVDMTLIVGGAAVFVAGSATTLPFLFSLG